MPTQVYVCPQDFGAAYNGITDDSTAVEKAIQAAANSNMFVYFPPGLGCAVTRTINVPPNVTLTMDAPLTYLGTADQVCLQIGNASTSTLLQQYRLQVVRAQVSSWQSENSIGIKLINMDTCAIHIVQANGFTIGAQCTADGQGFVYNSLELGHMMNNKIGLDLSAVRSGWVNENIFYNGRFGGWSGVNVNSPRYGVRIISPDNSYPSNNNNFFIKPCFELGQSFISQEAVPVLIYHGQENEFVSCRNEDNSTIFAKIFGVSTLNVFDIGYGLLSIENIQDQSQFPVSFTSARKSVFSDRPRNLIFNSGQLLKKACYYDTTLQVNIPDVHFATSSANTVVKAGKANLTSNYVELSNQAIGIFVQTKLTQRFVIKKDVEVGYGGRVIVICYDANGNILGEKVNQIPTVQGTSYSSPYFNTSVLGGGSVGGYITGSDSEDDFYFSVQPAVQFVRLLFAGGSAPLRIRSFSIFSPDETSNTWTGYEEIIPGVNLALNAPTSGTWSKGHLVLNDNPIELGTNNKKYILEGWQYLTSPNRWVERRISTGN
ncbi:glycosyl hydrolase family 28-related protein [Paenibacillus sp. KN14-4R]|uniref:glycosyl hydrolase family 28-related protein n=1 Tax=Paenibacillus sp. KN14-4R TaxID=3445773 RepID=UPI003FA08C95